MQIRHIFSQPVASLLPRKPSRRSFYRLKLPKSIDLHIIGSYMLNLGKKYAPNLEVYLYFHNNCLLNFLFLLSFIFANIKTMFRNIYENFTMRR